MGPGDRLESIMDPIDIDDDRLETAKINLEKVDVVGLNDRYDELLAELEQRYGLQIDEVESQHVASEPWEVSDALRQRIINDNAADIELYEFARDLRRRRAARVGLEPRS